MIDWEDPMDLSALNMRIGTDNDEVQGQRRLLALLQRRGMMELELDQTEVDDDRPEEDSMIVDDAGGD